MKVLDVLKMMYKHAKVDNVPAEYHEFYFKGYLRGLEESNDGFECDIHPMLLKEKGAERRADERLASEIVSNFNRGDFYVTLHFSRVNGRDDFADKDIRYFIDKMRERLNSECSIEKIKYLYLLQRDDVGNVVYHILINCDPTFVKFKKGFAQVRSVRIESDDELSLNIIPTFVNARTRCGKGKKSWKSSKNLLKTLR